jgi:hypothetical protein
MIIKFRDATISRFSTKELVSEEECLKEIESLKKENELLKSKDQDPQTSKLFAEKESLLADNEKLKLEVTDSVESLSHQYRSSLEFTDELREYIKEYIERDDMSFEQRLSLEVEKKEKEIAAKYEEQISKIQTDLDETYAANTQLREESEQQ